MVLGSQDPTLKPLIQSPDDCRPNWRGYQKNREPYMKTLQWHRRRSLPGDQQHLDRFEARRKWYIAEGRPLAEDVQVLRRFPA